jgi:multidrug efflux pump subunit AcrA (membrane-fusion protein)
MSEPGQSSGQPGTESDGESAFYPSWLGRLAAEIGSAVGGQILRVSDGRVSGELGRWPDLLAEEPLSPEASRLAQEAVTEREGRFAPLQLAFTDGKAGREAWLLAYPVLSAGEAQAVVVLQLALDSAAGLQRAMQQLQWGSAWIALQLRTASTDPAAGLALDLLASLLERDTPDLAAMALVQVLARQAGAGRVSLGWSDAGDAQQQVKLAAISDATEFDPRMNEVRLIEAAMREAILAGVTVSCLSVPAAGERWPAHEALRRGGGGPRIETYPLFVRQVAIGAVCVESEGEVTLEDAAQRESKLALSAAVLQLQRQAKLSAWKRVLASLGGQLRACFGPEAYRRKTAFAVVAMLTLFFAFKEGDYRLTAEAQLEPDYQRVLTVPNNGYLAEARARPGDEVKQGEVLVLLDDRELVLERTRWLTERDKLQKKLQEAVADHERASVNILSSQIAQTEAQLELVQNQLDRVEIKAPFDGLIVSGDPAQRLGAVLQKGDAIYQMAPRNAYRVLVRVPEARIADLAIGIKGRLQLNSVPGLDLQVELSRIHPFTERRDGASYFPVEAVLHGDLKQLRPGMQGVVGLDVGRRNLLSIWTRSLADWLRLRWWSIAG